MEAEGLSFRYTILVEIMESTIRIATQADYKEIAEVFRKTWLDTYPNESWGISEKDVQRVTDSFSATSVGKMVREKLAFIAQIDSKIVGVAVGYEEADFNIVQALYVLPNYQGRGIGTELLHLLEESFENAKPLKLSVAEYNLGAITFYKKNGYIADDDKRGTAKIMGLEIPEVMMEKVRTTAI
jgi:ribosomal protein S18 acetylase RimI-like enzyme